MKRRHKHRLRKKRARPCTWGQLVFLGRSLEIEQTLLWLVDLEVLCNMYDLHRQNGGGPLHHGGREICR